MRLTRQSDLALLRGPLAALGKSTLLSSICLNVARGFIRSERLFPARNTAFHKPWRSEAGITLVEVMVSAAIIAMVGTGLIYSQLLSNRIAQRSRYSDLAKVQLRELVDRFQSVDGTDALVAVTAGFTGSNLGITDVDGSIAGTQIYLYDSPSAQNPPQPNPKLETGRVYVEATIDSRVTALDSTGNAVLLGTTFRLYYGKNGEVIANYDPNGAWSDEQKALYVLHTMSTNRCIP